MASVSAFLATVRGELGYRESPAGSNCNKFSHALGRPCEPWCADMLVALARQVGLSLPSESASTRVMAKAFRDAGRWSDLPQVGAFAFWDFPDDTSGVQHVSVVESWTDTDVTTIDGNSSVSGSQSNGGQVVRRTRPKRWVVGFGLPLYEPVQIVLEGADAMTRVAVEFPGGRFDSQGRGWVLTDVPWVNFRNVIVNGRHPGVDGWDGNSVVWAAQERDGKTLVTLKGGAPGGLVPVVWVDRT